MKNFLFVCVLSFFALICQSAGASFSERKLEEGGSPDFSARSVKRISQSRYVAGGLIGTFLPFDFGLAHAVQGRYLDRGWIFTVTEAVGYAGFASSLYWIMTTENSTWTSVSLYLVSSFVLSLLCLKVFKTQDIWNIPSSYKTARRDPSPSLPSHKEWKTKLARGGPSLSVSFRF